MNKQAMNTLLGVLIFAPGVGFAVSNALPIGPDSASTTTAVAAIVLSGAVGAGVAVRPSRFTYGVGLAWSVFSVGFELIQANAHHGANSDNRAAVALSLAAVRLAGAVLSTRVLRSS